MLASQVMHTVAQWYINGITARDADVDDTRESELRKPPPAENQLKVRGWLRRYINGRRNAEYIRDLPKDWGKELAGGRALARRVTKATTQHRAETGTLYHHKHDVAPTQEELTAMTYSGFVGDDRVDAGILESVEAGMALGLYLPTGARGSELKKMYIQCLGYEVMQMSAGGITFEALKLMAFHTKTKEQHLNLVLPHSNPWRCGIGLFGISILVRVMSYGPPPFTMQTNEDSWHVFGSNVGTLDHRMKEVFRVAGIHRQSGDPVTYLGRHFGTRLLQHAGGTAEGGAARRGHSNGTSSLHYTECPLPDLLRLAGNDPVRPFVPAHHRRKLQPLADAVLVHLFPQLDEYRETLKRRSDELDAMRSRAKGDDRRSKEQLNDRLKMLRAIRLACRTALCCLVARPRTWKRWSILENETTLWQRAADPSQRVVRTLFGGRHDAIESMNALAAAVRRFEEAEIVARKASPEQAITTAMVSAVQQIEERMAARETQLYEHQQRLVSHLMSIVQDTDAATDNSHRAAPPVPPPQPCVSTVLQVPPPASPRALASARPKHKRQRQDDVKPFASWTRVADALQYMRTDLLPRETEEGPAWRIRKLDDNRQDRSRHTMWMKYRTLAIAVGAQMRDSTYDDAVAYMQGRLDALSHTAFLRELHSVTHSDPEALAALALERA